MTNAIPIRVVVDGSGDTTGLSEFRTNETVGLDHGGTGATNAADARTNLGLAAIAASGSWADLLNKPNTDDIPEGTTNLYFTDERVDDRVAALIVDGVGILKNYDDAGNLLNIEINFSEFDTDDIIEGSVNTFLANRSTSDIPEGTNLYFTDERVDDRVAALIVDGVGIQKNYDDAGNLLNIAIDFSEFDTDDIVEGTVNTFLSNRTTDDINEGTVNLYFTDARADARIALQTGTNLDLSQKTTTELSEGTNLYYTDARADARLATFGAVTQSDIDASIAALIDSSPTTLDTLNELAAALGDDPNFATSIANSIATKLAISDFNTTADNWLGTKSTTDLSEGTNLYFTDERVDDRVAALIQDGVGITKNYDDAGNLLDISINFTEFDTDDIIEGTVNTFLANRTTDDITEGSINLYYTDARFDTRLATKSTTDVAEGTNLYYTDARVDANIATKSTTDVAEGTNLYYTDARFDTRLTTKSTTDLTEGTNLYYTDARVDARITSSNPYSSADFDTDFSGKTTTDLTEGTNLYYTDARVRSHVEGQDLDLGTNKVLFSNVYNQLSDLPSASSYHGMFAHVHGTGKAYYAHAGNWIELGNNSDIPTSTDSLAEGSTNLYYTDARVGSYLTTNNYATQTYVDNAILTKDTIAEMGDVDLTTAPTNGQGLVWDNANSKWVAGDSFSQSDFDTAFTAKDTDDLSEGSTNLYYTDARVASYLSGTGYATTSYVTSQIAAVFSDLDDEVYDRERADINLQSQIDSLTTNVGALVLDDLGDVDTTTNAPTNGQTLIYNGTSFVPGTISGYTTADFNTDFATKTTTDLTEGTNLYYTDARADARVAAANIGILNDVNTVGISAGDFLLYDGSEFLPVDFATEVNTYADGRIGVASIQDLSDVDGVDTVASGDILLYDASNNHFGFINFGSEVNSYFDTRFATKSTTDLASFPRRK